MSSRWSSPAAAAIVLAAFYGLMLASVIHKSATMDEPGHGAAGCSYWRFGDYRLDPENGNLPQRIMALPLLSRRFGFPSLDSPAWHASDEFALSRAWFCEIGNPADQMLLRGRAICALAAVILAGLVWWCARWQFGPWGGMLALLLCVSNPSILANGPLMTSDTICALLFFAVPLGLWFMLQRLTPARVLASGLLMGGLAVSKMSWVLIIPIAFLLAAARIAEGSPLPTGWDGRQFLRGRGQMFLGIAAAAVAHVGIVVLVIWASFGFRYSAFGREPCGADRMRRPWEQLTDKEPPSKVLAHLDLTPSQHGEVMGLFNEQGIRPNEWTWGAVDLLPVLKTEVLNSAQRRKLDAILSAPPTAFIPRVMDFIDRHRLLPHAYTFGFLFVRHDVQTRSAFFNGEFGVTGWRGFFPYTVLVKTPLPVFGFALLGAGAIVAGWIRSRREQRRPLFRSALRSAYDGLPIWTLFIVYWAAAISSHINIGHRHILATYPALFVLGGGAAAWGQSRAVGRSVWARIGPAAALVGLLAAMMAEVFFRFPNYLAYFNLIAGGPDGAYRHLDDSSLDWGQDVPSIKQYIEKHPEGKPFYIAYFGPADPEFYHIAARSLDLNPICLIQQAESGGKKGIAGLLHLYPDYEFIGEGRLMNGGKFVALLQRPEAFHLHPGTYLISATRLQWGPWDRKYEQEFQKLYRKARLLMSEDRDVRTAGFRQESGEDWARDLSVFNQFRLDRLLVCLRNRGEPERTINGSVLVYRVSSETLASALDGPPPEDVKDVRIIEK